MNEDAKFQIDVMQESMDRSIDHLKGELANIRAGRANPSMLNGVYVDYYGTNTPINQVANISTPDARSIVIQPWEKSMLGEIEKSILQANIGITPQSDGEVVRLNLPILTEERRKALVKQVRSEGENAKVSLRSARHDALNHLKQLKKDGMPEDMAHRSEEKVDEITKDYTGKVDQLMESKEKEIMTV